MLDDFFTRALAAGIGVALVAGPLGCFVVWRRMAFFGDAMAHAALLGVALGFLLTIDLTVGVFAVAVAVAAALSLLQRQRRLPSDALLSILSHSTLSLGLVLLALMTWVRVDLIGYLFGDILAVSRGDVALIWGGGLVILGGLCLVWRTLLADTVASDVASAEGLAPGPVRLAFMVLMAATIAITMKLVGVLLITALLIIPAATARRFARTPEAMAVLAALVGALAVVGGLVGSLHLDTPSGPSIVVAALCLFLLSLSGRRPRFPGQAVGAGEGR